MRIRHTIAALALYCTSGVTAAATITVDEFVACSALGAGDWCVSLLTGTSTATLVDLTGAGGNLETNAPLPTGAARLATGPTNPDRAEAATGLGFDATTFLGNAALGYSYYKEAIPGGNAAAAPSMKLAIASSSCSPGQDCFGQLIFEPYLNQPGGIADPPTDAWQTVVIDSDTGSGSLASGGWWWTGGFGIGSSAAGPPYRSLNEWLTEFVGGSLATEFGTASVIGLSIGLGTFNADTTGFFDEVIVGLANGPSTTFDFEAAAVPEPPIVALMALGFVGIALRRRRYS